MWRREESRSFRTGPSRSAFVAPRAFHQFQQKSVSRTSLAHLFAYSTPQSDETVGKLSKDRWLVTHSRAVQGYSASLDRWQACGSVNLGCDECSHEEFRGIEEFEVMPEESQVGASATNAYGKCRALGGLSLHTLSGF